MGDARSNGRGVIMQLKCHATVLLPALKSQCQLVAPPNRKCSFLVHIPPPSPPPPCATIQLSATIKSRCGDGGWTSGHVSFFVPVLH